MATGGLSYSVVGSEDVFILQCGICRKKKKHREAKTFCNDCEEYLCSSCTDTHGQFPALRNHKTIAVQDMVQNCGICIASNKQKEARCYCKDCKSWVCDDCKESHENFRDLQKHTIVSGTAAAMIYSDSTSPCDVSIRLSRLSTKPSTVDSFRKSGSKTKPEDYGGNKNLNLQTQPSDDALNSHIKPSTDSPTAQHCKINGFDYKTIKKVKDINVKVSGDTDDFNITGCCFMPGGELVICDLMNSKIKLLDHSLSLVDSLDLPGKPSVVAAVDSSNFIVTMPGLLQFIQVPSLKLSRTIVVGEACWGVAVAAGKIFVSCNNPDDKVGHIRVYDLEGRDLGKRLGINPDGSNMFCHPWYVAVASSGDKIFVSDYDTDTVSCLTSDGKIVYQYGDGEMRLPQGLLVDENDNVIVCAISSNTVQVITSAGLKHKTLLSSKDGISHPWCVSFRPSDGTLVIGGWNNKLLVYKMS